MSRDTMPNAYVAGKGDLSSEDQKLVARRQQALGPAYRLFYETPVHLVRGKGVWLYDTAGTAYLDAYNNVACVGHCHPRAVAAMAAQAAALATHTRYLHDGILSYAERLLATFPAELSHAMFTCTGSEANDLALRIAREATGGTGIIVTENAYHGVTSAVAELSPSFGPGVPLGPHVRTVPPPDARIFGDDPGPGFAAAVADAAADLMRHGIRPAALLVDTIFSSDGVFVAPEGFLAPAVQAIRDAGGLFIADEVQPGFARTGAAMWGFQRHGIIPDIVTMGKPMGNGYPIAALVVRPGTVAGFAARVRYFNTFGGNAVAAATANAVLDVIEDEGLMENARVTGTYLAEGLRDLGARHGVLGEVRAAGLFAGADVERDGAPDAALAARIVNGLRARHVLISATGKSGHILKIRPPLTFGREHADVLLGRLDEVLVEV